MYGKGRTRHRRRKETIRTAGCRNLPDKLHSVTITHRDGRFYANLTCEVEPLITKTERPLRVIAFDPGVKTFLTGADDSGRLIESQSQIKRITKYFDRETDRVRSMRDRCKKGSRRWLRLKQVLHDLYQRRKGQVNGELHAIAKLPANGEWDIVGVGNPYKHGKCNHCGHRIKLDPSVRVYRCPECNMVFGRDDNSAINLLNGGHPALCPRDRENAVSRHGGPRRNKAQGRAGTF